ncbi:uridine phosphorylase [Sphaerisporangium siamense]|uniref:Uridine phosphorylase n=1 Tax=Sphaerisporangium siamense TaxID=795645 RepID=A0A7W7D3E8_9ACTN|nr:nucleoside phosphorylase [Sphaerisporangium siamense]MBB4699600.1 uridine phosphorylase [Sphaerisporangium siamense]GII87014.1 uridine phosphorylase [Sphaerisporangium siamense]
MSTDKLAHHLHLRAGDVGRYALLPSNPDHVAAIAALLDGAEFVARNREFETWRGTVAGEPVVVTSTGVGGPSTALAVEELAALGVGTMLRVGVSGSMRSDTVNGELAVLTGAIRDEGTTRQYLPVEFPAIASIDVVLALRSAAARAGVPYRCGTAHTKDSYYGEMEPERMPLAAHLTERFETWRRGGAVCSEMETAAVFIVGAVLGVRAGSVVMMWSQEAMATGAAPSTDPLFATAVDAIRALVAADTRDTADAEPAARPVLGV